MKQKTKKVILLISVFVAFLNSLAAQDFDPPKQSNSIIHLDTISLDVIHEQPPQVTSKTFAITNTGTDSLVWNISFANDPVFAAPGSQEKSIADPDLRGKAPKQKDKKMTRSIESLTRELVFSLDVQAITGDEEILACEFDGTYLWLTGGGDAVRGKQLYKVDPASQSLVATYPQPETVNDPGIPDLAVADGLLYGGSGNRFYSFDPQTETWTTLFDNAFASIHALAYDGNHFWTKYIDSPLYEFDISGSLINTYNVPVGNSACAAAFDDFYQDLYIINQYDALVYRFDLSGNYFGNPPYSIASALQGSSVGGAFCAFNSLVPGQSVLGFTGSGDTEMILAIGLYEAPQEVFANDLGIVRFQTPNSADWLSENEPVIVRIKNFGTEPQSDILLYCSSSCTFTFFDTLFIAMDPGEVRDVSLGQANASTYGIQEYSFTLLDDDDNIYNNNIMHEIVHTPPPYCHETLLPSPMACIYSVEIAAMHKVSDCQCGVANFTYDTIGLYAGIAEYIEVYLNYYDKNNVDNWDTMYVWIDWNKNYAFETGTNEMYILPKTYNPAWDIFSGYITPPPGTFSGEYAMRIRYLFTDPCIFNPTAYSEAEDYTVSIHWSPLGWRTVMDKSGVLAPGETQEIEVVYSSELLEIGETYTDTLIIASNAANAPLIELPVSLLPIIHQGEIAIIPGEVEFTLGLNGLETQPLTVVNQTTDTLDFTMTVNYQESDYKGSPLYFDTDNAKATEPVETMKPEAGYKAIDAIVCPANSFFSQPASNPSAFYYFDENAGSTVFQSLDVQGQISGIRFWAFNTYRNGLIWEHCPGEETRSFDIGFWSDNEGEPGDLIKVFENIEITRQASGQNYPGQYPIYEYTCEFPVAYINAAGEWLSIQAKGDNGQNCHTMILNEYGGTGTALVYDGTSYDPQFHPIGFCLTGIDDVVDWLSIEPSAASLLMGDSITFELTADMSAFNNKDFNYFAYIRVLNNFHETPVIDIPVSLLYTGIEKPGEEKSYILVYPNPSGDILHISSNYEIEGISIIDLSGRVVLRKKAKGMSLEINTQSIDAGTYILQIDSKQGTARHKIIKQQALLF